MHGLFDLADGVEEDAFRESFVRLSEHLQGIDMLLNWRFMRHQAHDGYNANEPSTQHYVSIEFANMDQAERCWSCIQEHGEPLGSLHQAVFSKVQNTTFFLSSDV